MGVPTLRRCLAWNNDGNPKPYRFEILKVKIQNNFALVKVNYPDCTNFEGNKIILIKDFEKYDGDELDPHFSDSSELNIIARFKPDNFGWDLGLMLMNKLNEDLI